MSVSAPISDPAHISAAHLAENRIAKTLPRTTVLMMTVAPDSPIHLVILFGGQSAEHDVSCVTAAHIMTALNHDRYSVTAIGIDRDGIWHESTPSNLGRGNVTAPLSPTGRVTGVGALANLGVGRNVVMPLLHGPLGEDGTVQGLLELLNLPFVGSGVLASAMCMDKTITKDILRVHGIPQVKYQIGRADLIGDDWYEMVVATLGLPVFVKPANMGSSIGVSKAKTLDELRRGIEHALTYDEWIVVEEASSGREIEISILGDLQPEASLPGEIIPGGDFYDYDDKYIHDSAKLVVPAHLDIQEIAQLQALAIRIYLALRVEGMARVDFFYEKDGRGFLCNEVNTIPGFTPISMYPKMWEASGLAYPDLIDRLVDLALARHARKRHKTSR
jgi:D-alanine-D-alanine ligase